MERVKTEF